jgi:hypothetical protein
MQDPLHSGIHEGSNLIRILPMQDPIRAGSDHLNILLLNLRPFARYDNILYLQVLFLIP